jgi:hypothetical protein
MDKLGAGPESIEAQIAGLRKVTTPVWGAGRREAGRDSPSNTGQYIATPGHSVYVNSV